jgi:hypothetical protein
MIVDYGDGLGCQREPHLRGHQFRESYRKVLVALSDGRPKTSNEICTEVGFEDRWLCTGAISMLRRMDAIDQAGHGKYRITDTGKMLLGKSTPLPLTQREVAAWTAKPAEQQRERPRVLADTELFG